MLNAKILTDAEVKERFLQMSENSHIRKIAEMAIKNNHQIALVSDLPTVQLDHMTYYVDLAVNTEFPGKDVKVHWYVDMSKLLESKIYVSFTVSEPQTYMYSGLH